MGSVYMRSGDVLLKHARGDRDVFGREFHQFNEIFFLVGGAARFTSDRLIERITPGTLVLVPKERFHQFEPEGGEEDYHRVVLQFERPEWLGALTGEVMDGVRVLREPSPETLAILRRFETLDASVYSEDEKKLLLRALFVELLLRLKYGRGDAEPGGGELDSAVAEMLLFISEHYLERITIRSIAESLSFSESYVSHRFKEVMRIPIYDYILKKKLTHAYGLIKSGTPAAEAAGVCGFADYSGFYKAYRRYFGASPSGRQRLSAAPYR
mgnify:CR=1 FL=1